MKVRLKLKALASQLLAKLETLHGSLQAGAGRCTETNDLRVGESDRSRIVQNSREFKEFQTSQQLACAVHMDVQPELPLATNPD